MNRKYFWYFFFGKYFKNKSKFQLFFNCSSFDIFDEDTDIPERTISDTSSEHLDESDNE